MAVTWLNTGNASQEGLKKAEAEQKKRQEARSGMWRFWLKPGESARITFVDGFLTKAGLLDFVSYREHHLFLNGEWGNHFVCLEGTPEGPCPICATGDNASFVGAFTILDHRKIPSAKEAGKFYTDSPRLYVATMRTVKLLQTMAAKRGGLAGCTFEVMRTSDKDVRVGNHFDFEEKHSIEELKAKYMRPVLDKDGKPTAQQKTIFVPANYEKEIPFKNRAEVLSIVGGQGTPVGAEPDPAAQESTPASAEAYAQHL